MLPNLPALIYNQKGELDTIPRGAHISWSKATRFNAGRAALSLVMGNALDKNENHLNCNGDMMNPNDMNRVNLSKSNGGGVFLCWLRISMAYGLFS